MQTFAIYSAPSSFHGCNSRINQTEGQVYTRALSPSPAKGPKIEDLPLSWVWPARTCQDRTRHGMRIHDYFQSFFRYLKSSEFTIFTALI
ncbi:hypothetical protein OIU79_013993 [Salix purpurea]|uniref:Uncharacterized protein n=1 Tax=Salix purpurea TaxID=77065 RepID=A0A9Q0SWC2_SALPP|nr:hypothetical protein OIU79_013993 [Salix purpurea]